MYVLFVFGVLVGAFILYAINYKADDHGLTQTIASREVERAKIDKEFSYKFDSINIELNKIGNRLLLKEQRESSSTYEFQKHLEDFRYTKSIFEKAHTDIYDNLVKIEHKLQTEVGLLNQKIKTLQPQGPKTLNVVLSSGTQRSGSNPSPQSKLKNIAKQIKELS